MNRGDRREPIFNDDEDRLLFLHTLGEACEKTDWQIHAFCLMNNHFHLVTETPRGNLVDGMQWFLEVYTNRFNHRQKEFGHLFSGLRRETTLTLEWIANRLHRGAATHVANLLQRVERKNQKSEKTLF
jgi:REP element-mobilizing transposase RayT